MLKQLCKKYLGNLKDEELKILLNEIENYENTGILKIDSKIRKIKKEILKTAKELSGMDYKGFDKDYKFTILQIYKEIARRYFNK